jgi:predicted nucleotidyltransferase
MSLFGSVARGNSRSDSDIDILISFSPDAGWSLLDHVAMQEEMSTLLQRNVDLVTRRSIERSANEIRKRSILEGTVRNMTRH